ncbi:MAG: hypothetical protein V1850_07410 [Candidatus Bathyarchaeota archaeon]
MDWGDACAKAAELIDANSKEFKEAVQREAQRLYKSRLMGELNKARSTVEERAFNKALELVRTVDDNFHVPCGKCGKPMQFSDRDKIWESEIKPALYEAFKDWSHANCAKT